MKKILLLTGMLLALTASLASAVTGLDAAWNGCPLTLSNPTDATDPCNDNGGLPHIFVLAVNAPANSKWVGEELNLDVQTEGSVLPAWWHLESADPNTGAPAGCRDGSASFGTTRGPTSTTGTCKDYWGTTAQAGGLVWLPGINGFANRTRMFAGFARSTATAGPTTAGVEYYVGSGAFDTNHAVADPLDPLFPVCQGCNLGACLSFNYLAMRQPAGTAGGDKLIETANLRRHLTWQGAVNITNPTCPAATALRKATWGQVKSLYR